MERTILNIRPEKFSGGYFLKISDAQGRELTAVSKTKGPHYVDVLENRGKEVIALLPEFFSEKDALINSKYLLN